MAEFWADLISKIGERTLPAGIIGTVVVLILLLLLLRRRPPKKIVAYTTENGCVIVSRNAIIELVQTSCAQLKEVSKPKVKIKIKGGLAYFQVRIKLASGSRLREIERTLQNHLRNALTENLGIESLGKIDIIATGFKSDKISSSTSSLKMPEKPNISPNAAVSSEAKLVEESGNELKSKKNIKTSQSKPL